MAYRVVWTELARDHYHNQVAYLIKKWSIETAERFIGQLENSLDGIKEFPYLGRASLKRQEVSELCLG